MVAHTAEPGAHTFFTTETKQERPAVTARQTGSGVGDERKLIVASLLVVLTPLPFFWVQNMSAPRLPPPATFDRIPLPADAVQLRSCELRRGSI